MENRFMGAGSRWVGKDLTPEGPKEIYGVTGFSVS